MRRFTLLFLIVLLGALVFLQKQPGQAAPYYLSAVNSLDITGFNFIDNDVCGNVDYQPYEVPTLNAIVNVDTVDPNYVGHPSHTISVLVYDSTGREISGGAVSLSGVNGPNDDFSFGLQLIQTPSVRPWRLVFMEEIGVELASFIFDPANIDSRCGMLPYEGIVLLANQNLPDDVQVFGGLADDGDYSIDIYRLNDNGDGYFLFDITQADLAPYIDNPPAQNTELESVDDVSLYILTTGEYQLNIGPDEEGKVRVIVFEGLPPTDVYSYDFNVYDILDE